MLVLLALPCAVALIVFPKALVAVLFHYGQFQPQDVTQTTRALMGYGVGLMGLVGVKVLAPGFYARHDIRTPVRIAIVVLVATQAMNALLVPRLGHAGLALVDRPGRAGQCRLAADRPAPCQGLPAAARLGRVHGCACCWPAPRWARCWPGPARPSTGSACRRNGASAPAGWRRCWRARRCCTSRAAGLRPAAGALPAPGLTYTDA